MKHMHAHTNAHTIGKPYIYRPHFVHRSTDMLALMGLATVFWYMYVFCLSEQSSMCTAYIWKQTELLFF